MRKGLGMVLAALATTAVLSAPARGEWITLRSEYGDLPDAYQRLVDRLFSAVAYVYDYENTVVLARIETARVDLNGDGVDEMFVAFGGAVFCGNSSWCAGSLYQRDGSGWRLIGTPEFPDIGGSMRVFIEDVRHLGWRVFNAGYYRACWTNSPDPERTFDSDTFEVIDRADGDPGYFAGVEAGEPCR